MPTPLDELWVPEFERVTLTRGPGAPFRTEPPPDVPFMLIQHTVEGDPRSAEATRTAYVGHPYAPNLWGDHEGADKIMYQGISLGMMSFSLERTAQTKAEGVETNGHFGTIQFELEGTAARTGEYGSADIAELAWIYAATWQTLIDGGYQPGPLVPWMDVGRGSEAYGYRDQWEMSLTEWRTRRRGGTGEKFNVAPHAAVYRQTHWDAGPFPFGKVCALANRQIGTAGPIVPPRGGAVERLEKVTGFPGQIKIEGASAQQRLYAYFTPEGADKYEAKVTVYPKDGRFVRYVDVAGGATYRVDLDDGANGVPGAPMTVEVDAAASVPAVPVGNPHPVLPATDLAGIRRQALLVKAALAETNKLVDDLVARIDS